MKKCPKCKAEIQEEARFCLYCMTSFEEKQTIETPKEIDKRWLIFVAAVLVLVLIVLGILLFAKMDSPNNAGNDPSANSSFSSDLGASDDNTASSEQQNSESQGNETSTPTSSSQIQNLSKNENNTTGNTTSKNSTTSSNSQNSITPNSTSNNSNSVSTANNSTPGTSTPANNTTSNGTSSTTDTQPKYTYIEATMENAYPTGYGYTHGPENAIVITKVNYKEESGNYSIPNTIDGKAVMAIMPSAFCDSSISSSVKSVTLPVSVKTIWSNAFKDCFNLTDLYIGSRVIGIYEDALPDSSKRTGKLTIHCKKDCMDFEFYYYRNIADHYDANYKEWNG